MTNKSNAEDAIAIERQMFNEKDRQSAPSKYKTKTWKHLREEWVIR